MMGPRGGGPGGPGGPGRPPMRAGMGPFGGGMLPPEKAKDARRTFGRLLLTLRPELWRIAIVIAFAVVSVGLAVLGPRILGDATNLIFAGVAGKQLATQGIPAGTTPEQLDAMLRAAGQTQIADMLSTMHVVVGVGVDFGALAQILLLATFVYVLSSVFSGLQSWIMAGVSQRTVYRLRQDVDQKMARLPLRYFDSHQRGDTLSRMTNDIDNISTSLQQTMTQLINAVCTIVGVLVMMLLISPLLAVVSLLTVPLSIAITIAIAKRSQKQFAAQWAVTGALNGHIEEMHTGHAIVKAFGRQEEAIREFDEKNAALYGASRRAQFLSGTIQPALQFVANLNYVAICVIGGLQVASGQLSLGDVQAFVQYSRMFTMPITQTATIANVIQSAIASAERVFELLDEPEEIADPAEPVRLPTPTGRVAFDDISFRYVPDQPLMEHLDLTVEPGHTVAIVGPTGAGKTTLVNLLLRFYDVDEGAITVDGVDIRSLTRDQLRSMFGMVLQDTWLFHGTIRENIAYGDPSAPEDRILAAAADAHVDHFVRTLPDGYDTVIDDEATNVSAGEKQLLTIARAFLADPRILILDEATSSVDTRTEVLIQRAMARLMEGRTSFVIAHRLSTIRDADTILVMDLGRIVEQGTHESLLAKGGFYADLYESQFGEPLEAAS